LAIDLAIESQHLRDFLDRLGYLPDSTIHHCHDIAMFQRAANILLFLSVGLMALLSGAEEQLADPLARATEPNTVSAWQ